jgi:hypothetical protein
VDSNGLAAAAATGAVTLRAVATRCGPGDCPTVYVTDRNTVVVQGYAVAPADAGISVPAGELLVEIPADLLPLAVHNLDQP